MLAHTFDPDHAILTVRPSEPIARHDFEQLSAEVDPYIEEHGALAGLLFEAASFKGWDSVAAFVEHMRFVKDHHKLVRRVALVTDSPIGDLAQALTRYFAAAKVRHFPADEAAEASAWIRGEE